MSILIKGMEMPTSCSGCPMLDWDLDYIKCKATGRHFKVKEEPFGARRVDDCPLVPVPPHGDLIDRDALMKILSKVIDINASIEQRNEATDQERRCLWWFEQQIGIAPTIIPAEEGE